MRTTSDDGPQQLGREWPKHHVYGVTLASDFPFTYPLTPSQAPADLAFTCVTGAPPAEGWARSKPAFSTPPGRDGESLLHLYRTPGYDVLYYTDIAEFYLWPERIVCRLVHSRYEYLVELYLLGIVLALWLERRGLPVFHASAVAVNARAATFLAWNEGGKSSLAAILMQGGHPLLTDDLLVIDRESGEFVGRPGYRQMRLWPDQAEYFLGSLAGLEMVHPAETKRRVPVGPGGLGAFCDTSLPLACIYLPARRRPGDDRATEIVPVSPSEALIELVRRSFLPNMTWAAGFQSRRMKLFSEIVRGLPIRRLLYPSGVPHLPTVRRVILEDLAALEVARGARRPFARAVTR